MNQKNFQNISSLLSCLLFLLLENNACQAEKMINVVPDDQLPQNAVPMDDPNGPLNPFFLDGKKNIKIIPDDAVPEGAISLNGSDLPPGLADPQKDYKVPMLDSPARILDTAGEVLKVTDTSEFVVESSLPKPKSTPISPLQVIQSEQLLQRDILSSNTIEPFNPIVDSGPSLTEAPVCKIPEIKNEDKISEEAKGKEKKKKKRKRRRRRR